MSNHPRRRSSSISIVDLNGRKAAGEDPIHFHRESRGLSRQHENSKLHQIARYALRKENKPRRSNSEAPAIRERHANISMASQVYSRFKGVFSQFVKQRQEQEHGIEVDVSEGDVQPRGPIPIESVSDERCNEMVHDNILYMYSFQCLPLDLTKSALTERKRTVYLAWLHEIWSYHTYYHPTNSFFIAVHLLDRFVISLSPSSLKDEEKMLESAGLAALQLAVKFETQSPLADDLVRSFKITEINRYEHLLLEICDFELGRHTVIDLVRLAMAAISLDGDDRNAETRHVQAKFLSIISVFCIQLVGVKPSVVAAAIARLLVHMEQRSWSTDIQEKLQHSAAEVLPVLGYLTAYIGEMNRTNWPGKEVIKYWRGQGADLASFDEGLLSEVYQIYAEEAERFGEYTV